MPGPKATVVTLSAEEQAALEQLVRRHTTPQQIALRARIILAAAQGQTNSAIRAAEGVTLNTVRLWRKRWVALQAIALADLSAEERLADAARPGAPWRITADQRCQIEALACQRPEEHERPITHWTARKIADEIIQQGIVESISPRHAARLLKRCPNPATPEPLLAHDHA
jgi:putative transposase